MKSIALTATFVSIVTLIAKLHIIIMSFRYFTHDCYVILHMMNIDINNLKKMLKER